MRDYRLYCVTSDGKIDLADWFTAEDDDTAIMQARYLRPDASLCEIWHKRRLVAKIGADGQVERFLP